MTESPGRPGGRDDRLLAWPAVRDITGLSRTTAWRMQKTGDFPLPVVVSPGRVCWWESELVAWRITRARRHSVERPPFGSASERWTTSRAAAEEVQALEDVVEYRAASGSAGRVTQDDAAIPESAGQRRSRQRSGATAPEQIAFDFGP